MSIRSAQSQDLPALLAAMQDFYRLEKLPWDAARQEALLAALINTPEAGRLLIAEREQQLAAYAAIGFCFSLEFGGRFALLDELYVLPAFQGLGLGKQLMQASEQLAREQHCQAVRLEVSDDNPKARDIYLRSGYRMQPRRLMSYWL
ncbi:MAG: GNAT family N-acetyltransferase [Pseudomonadota bacterium]|nr:GNAT family N-acetyltransferase [Pseudomonadota bacterium]